MTSLTTLSVELISTRWRDYHDQIRMRNPDECYLMQVAESMKHFGYLSGKRVLIYDDTSTIDLYQLIDGLYRFRAAKLAGFHEIPVLIFHGGLSNDQLQASRIEKFSGPFKTVKKMFRPK